MVITPFVHAQLTQPHRDVALGALLIAWWLSSHLFMATSHALDDCYGVRDHRPTFVQRFIALAFGARLRGRRGGDRRDDGLRAARAI